MISITDRIRDVLNILGAALWVVLVVVSWIGTPLTAYIGLLAVAMLSGIYFILGTTVRGKIGSLVPLLYPALIMAVLWIVAFTIAYRTRGQSTTAWILGLHPGQFWPLLFFWAGTFVTSMVSYALYFDRYLLPDGEWEAFLNEVKKTRLTGEKSGR